MGESLFTNPLEHILKPTEVIRVFSACTYYHMKFCSTELLTFQVFFVEAETSANKFELIAKNCFPGCLNWAETEDPTPLP